MLKKIIGKKKKKKKKKKPKAWRSVNIKKINVKNNYRKKKKKHLKLERLQRFVFCFLFFSFFL